MPEHAAHDGPTGRHQAGGPLAGISVVEAAFGTSTVGAGMAAALPGALLADLGAEVTTVRTPERSSLDAGTELTRGWDRGKDVLEVSDRARVAEQVHRSAPDADVVVLMGAEREVERRGLTYRRLADRHPGLVVVRIRGSVDAAGPVPDLELLVQARAGLLTQIRGHRSGPIFGHLPVAAVGAALSATAGALALLYQREDRGTGGWVETSLLDGVAAILPMIIGRVEHPSPTTALLWERQGPTEALSYRCLDDEFIQLWFGAKGAYEAFLDHMGEPPSEGGYTADLVGGGMAERSARWAERFRTRERASWLADLAGQPFRCEPVLRPGEALRDEHVAEVGLSAAHQDPARGEITVLGPITAVEPVGATGARPRPAGSAGHLLDGVRVLDLSAYLAGPVAPQVLAELGAEVVKVEPVTGDAHRSMEPMFAAGQRGKQTVALDLKAPGATDVLHRLFRWSDVVHHNSRVGLAERLGYDEATARSANPDVVYSFASGFGGRGPRAALPANDHLMQALSGIEAAQGAPGQPPTFLVWGAIDVTSGWVAACSVIAGLYGRRVRGGGQSVSTSLLGAALLLESGTFLAGRAVVSGPVLDPAQTGYGAAYRIYRAGDGRWLALAVPDTDAWTALLGVVGAGRLPASPPPLRRRPDERQPAEEVLEAAFETAPAATWVARLRAAGVPVEPVAEVDRVGFVHRVLDDPVSRQLGRVVSFEWGARGWTEQPGFAARLGPAPRRPAPAGIAGLGEHTHAVLERLGFDDEQRAELATAGTVVPP